MATTFGTFDVPVLKGWSDNVGRGECRMPGLMAETDVSRGPVTDLLREQSSVDGESRRRIFAGRLSVALPDDRDGFRPAANRSRFGTCTRVASHRVIELS